MIIALEIIIPHLLYETVTKNYRSLFALHDAYPKLHAGGLLEEKV